MALRQLSRRKKAVFFVAMLLIPVVVASAFPLGYALVRSAKLYGKLKSGQRGWSGTVHRTDPELGFAPVPNSRGAEIMPLGSDIPMRYDEDGFRVPVDVVAHTDDGQAPGPVVMALGCSVTYGAATHAEDTYPYLVGEKLGGSTKNAAVCSYGLAQMVLLARKLIPEHKPDYLLVQYSAWLVERSISVFAPTRSAKMPNPYFSEDAGALKLQPPVFQVGIYDVPIDEYRNSRKGVADFASFIWSVGLPLFVRDDFHTSKYYLERTLGLRAAPASDRSEIIRQGYGEILELAAENGVTPILVVLGSNEREVRVQYELLPQGSIVVNAHAALLSGLPVVERETYRRQYAHWRGDPPTFVDGHPNEKAHMIIADEIVSAIGRATEHSQLAQGSASQPALQ